MKQVFISLMAFFMIFGIFAGGAAAKTVDLRYGLWAKPGEAQYDGAMKFKEVLEKASAGAIKVTVRLAISGSSDAMGKCS